MRASSSKTYKMNEGKVLMPWLYIQVSSAQIERDLAQFAQGLPRAAAQPIADALAGVRAEVSKPAPHPTYPLQWDSSRQRAAFYASGGFGRGIPYQRSGNYERGWQVQGNTSSDGSTYGYTLINANEHAVYVQGDAQGYGQSRIHRGRWPLFSDVVNAAIANLPDRITAELYAFAQRCGLNPRNR
jgi:hypothetical protein